MSQIETNCPICKILALGKILNQTAEVFVCQDADALLIAPKSCVHDPRSLSMNHNIELMTILGGILSDIVPGYATNVTAT